MDFWDLKHELSQGGFFFQYLAFAVIISSVLAIVWTFGLRALQITALSHSIMKCIGEALFRLL